LGYSGIRIYSGIFSSYSAPGSRIGGMEIQVFRNENSSQTNAYSHYSNYSYSGLIPNERALKVPVGHCHGSFAAITAVGENLAKKVCSESYLKALANEDTLLQTHC